MRKLRQIGHILRKGDESVDRNRELWIGISRESEGKEDRSIPGKICLGGSRKMQQNKERGQPERVRWKCFTNPMFQAERNFILLYMLRTVYDSVRILIFSRINSGGAFCSSLTKLIVSDDVISHSLLCLIGKYMNVKMRP